MKIDINLDTDSPDLIDRTVSAVVGRRPVAARVANQALEIQKLHRALARSKRRLEARDKELQRIRSGLIYLSQGRLPVWVRTFAKEVIGGLDAAGQQKWLARIKKLSDEETQVMFRQFVRKEFQPE